MRREKATAKEKIEKKKLENMTLFMSNATAYQSGMSDGVQWGL